MSCPAARRVCEKAALVCPLLGPSRHVESVRSSLGGTRPAGKLTNPWKLPCCFSGMQMKGPERPRCSLANSGNVNTDEREHGDGSGERMASPNEVPDMPSPRMPPDEVLWVDKQNDSLSRPGP